MNYLLYSSNEMFSATELVRKGKKIFDKLAKKEIEKAIILRDGKPSFVMLDFNFYEDIMSEYLMLKKNLNSNNITQIDTNNKIKDEVKRFEEELEKIEEKIDEEDEDFFEQEYIDEDLKALEEFEINKKPNDSILNEFLDLKEEADKLNLQNNNQSKENSQNLNEKLNDLNNELEQVNNNETKDIIAKEELSEEERLTMLKKEEEELKKTLEALEKLNLAPSHKEEAKKMVLEKNKEKLDG